MQCDAVGVLQLGIHRDGRPFLAAVCTWQHPRSFRSWLREHVFLRDECIGAANELALDPDSCK